MGVVWNLLSGTARVAGHTGRAVGRAAVGQIQQARIRGQLPLGAGENYGSQPILDPGVLDYRGLARPRELMHAADGQVPLGRVIDLRRGPQFEVGLPANSMARHAAVVGTTGSGKTQSVIVPWITAALARGEHVVAMDVTGDLLPQIIAHQGAHNPLVNVPVVYWDFTRPRLSTSWNWLLELDTDDAFVTAAEALVGKERPGDSQPYFGQRDRRILAALLRAVRFAQPTTPQAELLTYAARDQRVLQRLAEAVPAHIGSRLVEAARLDSWEFGRYMSGVVNALDFLDHPGVRAVTTADRFRLANLVQSPFPTLVGVSAPLSAGPTGVSASSLMLALLKRELYRQFGNTGRRRVNLMIDEAARLEGRFDFEEVLAVSRRAGVNVTIALQNTEQFRDEATGHTVLDNCGTFIFMPSPSAATVEYFQSRLGTHEVPVLGQSTQQASWSRPTTRSFTQGLETRPVLGTRELMNPPWDGQLAFVHAPAISGAPFVVDLTRPDLC